MKLVGKLLVGSRQMLSSLREKAVAGALVVNRSLCEHTTKGKKKQVLGGGLSWRSCTPKGWHSQRNIQEKKKLAREAGRGRLHRAVL